MVLRGNVVVWVVFDGVVCVGDAVNVYSVEHQLL